MNDERNQPNRDQALLWNESSGQAWVEMQDVLDRLFAPFEQRLVDEAFPGEGGRVLDIGCGAGATTVAMARRLGDKGLCLGVDISLPLIATAKKRARESAAFLQADAQTHAFVPRGVDAVMSRFGVMFFDDPVAAFDNIRRAARTGAKLVFAAWRSPGENPFMTAAGRAAAPLLPSLRTPSADGPGQFAFADGDRVRTILESSGWSDVDVAPLDVPSSMTESDLHAYVTKLGPVGVALRSADESTRVQVGAAVRDAFAPFLDDGVARFTAACWLVTARAQ